MATNASCPLPAIQPWTNLLGTLIALKQVEALEQHLLRMLAQVFHFTEAALYVTDEQDNVTRLIHYVLIEAFFEGDSPTEHIVHVKHSKNVPPEDLLLLAELQHHPQSFYELPSQRFLLGYELSHNENENRYLIFPTNEKPSAEQEHLAKALTVVFRNYEELFNSSRCDKLTGLLNRHSLEQSIDQVWTILAEQREIQDAEARTIDSLAYYWMGVIDIDHFKRVNDTYGHLIGDEILLRVARIIKNTLRGSDLVYRYGGEEFVAIVATNSLEGAVTAYERVRQAVEQYSFPQVGQVTVSIGFSGANADMLPQAVLNRADRALYKAKEDGRNRVYHYESLTASNLLQDVDSGSIELF